MSEPDDSLRVSDAERDATLRVLGDPGAPRVMIRAYNLMGGATIFRVPPQARGLDLKEARRLAKAAGRGQLPALD